MRCADGHIDHADLVLHLSDHDTGFARVRRHPVQNTGRRAHGVGRIEFHTRCGAAHGHGSIATQDRVAILSFGKGARESREVGGGIIIASPRDPDVFSHHGLTFLLELLLEDGFYSREADPHHMKAGADGERVLRNLVSCDVGQL